MGNLIAAVVRAVLALARITWVVCKQTGRLLMTLVPHSGEEAPLAKSESGARGGSAARQLPREDLRTVEPVLELARKMAAESAGIEDIRRVSPAVVQWLSSLDRLQLCKLVCAKPTDLKAYFAGRGELRGLPRYLSVDCTGVRSGYAAAPDLTSVRAKMI